MKGANNLLVVRQLDKKLKRFKPLQKSPAPSEGWLKAIRKSLNMSLVQLGSRISITSQSLKEVENREVNGTVTLNKLKEVGDALGLRLVYGFVPYEETLEKMIEKKASEIARKIVTRTSISMKLEDQENTQKRLNQAIKELTEELKRQIPKSLWD
ncbi:mobile mystery protein A [Flavihumibacter sp. UBA7668]|uniref:mobile mystery protein A n=1 Tax=Flavihumibacter sp. UBA7668 TaxID=1946542 RepID=UPI0025C19159|nr:mobile mystery protein A [Flavihumibacter sp. UBA7668]